MLTVCLHFLKVGRFNRTGKLYKGHFDIWRTNHLQDMVQKNKKLSPDSNLPLQWPNGNHYVSTNESFGVLPIPRDVQRRAGMAPHFPVQLSAGSKDGKQPRHHHLACAQDVHIAVLPVHTREERKQFSNFMRNNEVFMQCGSGDGENWAAAASVWNANADGKKVFYKVGRSVPGVPNFHPGC